MDVKSRHVQVAGSAVRVYCSEQCLRDSMSGAVKLPVVVAVPKRRRRWPHAVGIAIGLGVPTWLVLGKDGAVEPARPIAAAAAAEQPTAPNTPAVDPVEAAFVAELTNDAWFHPIAGPTRRMPKNHSQAFGAERPGDRPAECFSGHCGVDVGGNLWGEPIHAVHDGVVHRVNRGPNEERGGIYVVVAHRDATVFTQYFHLAAVPRGITPGTAVKAGQVIGLLGDTGVKHSAPHLHFSITVKPDANSPERYLDPEPLLAIWPLFVPGEHGPRVLTHSPPGLPARVRGGWKKPAASARKAAVPAADLGAAPVSAPSEIEPSPTP